MDITERALQAAISAGMGAAAKAIGTSNYSNATGDFVVTVNDGTKTVTLGTYADAVFGAALTSKSFAGAKILRRNSSTGAVDPLPTTNVTFAANVLTLADLAGPLTAATDEIVISVPGSLKPARAIYNAAPTNRTEGQSGPLQADSLGNELVSLGTAIRGEDFAHDVMKVEEQFSYLNIVLAAPTTTVVKSGEGLLHLIQVNKLAASGVITIYDNTAASGTMIATITNPATLLASQANLFYDVKFSIGLTIVTSGAAQDITVSYR